MIADRYPLTLAQEARLFLEELAAIAGAEVPSNQFPILVLLDGELDESAVCDAVKIVANRHAALRATYAPIERYGAHDRRVMAGVFGRTGMFIPGFFIQTVAAQAECVLERAVDSSGRPTPQAFARHAIEAARAPMCRPPVLRATVISFDERTHLLIVVVSHLAVDGISAGIIRRELIELYTAAVMPRRLLLPPVITQAPDLVAAERRQFRNGEMAVAAGYWHALWPIVERALIPHRRIPWGLEALDRIPVVETAKTIIDTDCTSRLRAQARSYRVSLFVLVRTLFTLFMHGCTGRSRVAIWGNFANRPCPAAEPLVACCSTQHPVLSSLEDQTVAEFCTQINATLRQGQRHEHVSMPALPLFFGRPYRQGDTRVVFDTWPSAGDHVPGVPARAVHVPEARSWVDFDVRVQDNVRTLAIIVCFNAARYSGERIVQMLVQLTALIHAATGDCAALPARRLALDYADHIH